MFAMCGPYIYIYIFSYIALLAPNSTEWYGICVCMCGCVLLLRILMIYMYVYKFVNCSQWTASMSRCARDIFSLSLGVLSSPDSSANIFIFSLNDSFSGTASPARCCCCCCCFSARRRVRGSLLMYSIRIVSWSTIIFGQLRLTCTPPGRLWRQALIALWYSRAPHPASQASRATWRHPHCAACTVI